MKKVSVALATLALASCGAIAPDETVTGTESAVTFNVGAARRMFSDYWACSPGSVAAFAPVGGDVSLQPHILYTPYGMATHTISLGAESSDQLGINMWPLPLYPAMDGPYHVLYNITGVGVGMEPLPFLDPDQRDAANPHFVKYPAQVPAYGIWIYASGERPDYPNGVMVLTLDPRNDPYLVPPMSSPLGPAPTVLSGPDGWHGRCDHRVQFVFSL